MMTLLGIAVFTRWLTALLATLSLCFI